VVEPLDLEERIATLALLGVSISRPSVQPSRELAFSRGYGQRREWSSGRARLPPVRND
jgi:hypothetical protein